MIFCKNAKLRGRALREIRKLKALAKGDLTTHLTNRESLNSIISSKKLLSSADIHRLPAEHSLRKTEWARIFGLHGNLSGTYGAETGRNYSVIFKRKNTINGPTKFKTVTMKSPQKLKKIIIGTPKSELNVLRKKYRDVVFVDNSDLRKLGFKKEGFEYGYRY
jgi:hypothetical protein